MQDEKTSAIPVQRNGHSRTHGLRVLALWAAVIIGCLSFSSYVVVRWVERQVLTTDNWITLVSPLPKQPVVSTALGNYIGNQVFNEQAVEQKIRDALPRADFLAAPLASQLQTVTTKAAQKIVASDAFQTIWVGANRAAMNRLLATARGTTPPLQQKINERFNINISDSVGKLRDALGKAADAIPALQPAAQKTLDVSADLHARPRPVHQVIRATDTSYAILPFVVLAAFLSALAFAMRRRLTLMVSAVAIFVLLLIELVALKVVRQDVLAAVHNPDNTSAVSYIFDTLASGLKARIYVALGIAAVIWLLCLVGGPMRWAVKFRSWIALDRLRTTRVGGRWHVLRIWVRQYMWYLWLAVVVIVLGVMALLTTISMHAVVNALLLIISLWAELYIIATPHAKGLHAM